MSLAAPLVACTTGMNTPSTSVVTSTEASAAKLGTALRRIDRVASFKKNAGFMYFRAERSPSSPVLSSLEP